MIRFTTIGILLLSMVFAATPTIRAEEQEHHQQALRLPPDLMVLLQAEMREITTGIQKIPVAIAQADWKVLAETAESIQSSYILAMSLTPEQIETLESDLPERFKQMDSAFHKRAGDLAQAAKDRDFELATYHYSRLMEGCAQCHALFAQERFPAFAPVEEHGHQH